MTRRPRQPRAAWLASVFVALVTLASLAVLVVWNLSPGLFPPGAHAALGSAPLALIALALVIYQFALRAPRFELLRGLVVCLAFLSWAANQLLPDSPHALLLNDIAIALFVVDVVLLIVSRPPRP